MRTSSHDDLMSLRAHLSFLTGLNHICVSSPNRSKPRTPRSAPPHIHSRSSRLFLREFECGPGDGEESTSETRCGCPGLKRTAGVRALHSAFDSVREDPAR